MRNWRYFQARKAAERERKKAEVSVEKNRVDPHRRRQVRRRLEEAGRAKKAKKGFLTPERKKKLRVTKIWRKAFLKT